MNRWRLTKPICVLMGLAVAGVAMPQPARGELLFEDGFESGTLAAYTGQSGGGHTGVIVADPLEADLAVSFTSVKGGGDIFTSATFSHASNQFFLEFDYLGDPNQGGLPGNLGGFIGYSFGLPGGHTWLGGTGSFGGIVDLPDTGVWEHVILSFATSTPFHIMLEDFVGPIAGDAYFDNLRLHGGAIEAPAPVPEPTSLAIWSLLGVVGIVNGWRRRRKAKQTS